MSVVGENNKTIQWSPKDEEFLLYCVKELAKNVSADESVPTPIYTENGKIY